MKLEGSDNPVVKALFELSHGNTQSVLNINAAFLAQMDTTEPGDDGTIQVVEQIAELNACLDGQADCGLDSIQIKEILSYISTL